MPWLTGIDTGLAASAGGQRGRRPKGVSWVQPLRQDYLDGSSSGPAPPLPIWPGSPSSPTEGRPGLILGVDGPQDGLDSCPVGDRGVGLEREQRASASA